jgi:hypothetical protein
MCVCSEYRETAGVAMRVLVALSPEYHFTICGDPSLSQLRTAIRVRSESASCRDHVDVGSSSWGILDAYIGAMTIGHVGLKVDGNFKIV